MKQLEDNTKKHLAIFAVVGNHDVQRWSEPGTGYRDRLLLHNKRAGMQKNCQGELGVNQVCIWKDMVRVSRCNSTEIGLKN